MRFPEISGEAGVATVPTRHGPVTATIYRPVVAATSSGVYVNFHGGGFVVGHPEQDDPWCRYLAARANVVVVNVDYALAPGRRFPIPVEQNYDVVSWASSPDREWDGSTHCLGGQSAGGNLSAAVSRLALEESGPPIALQVLHYAPLDLVTPTADKRSPLGKRAILKPWMGEVFDTAYVPSASDRRHRFVSPAWGYNADGTDGIAPALVVSAEYDRLRDEAERYARKLEQAGSLVRYHEMRGVDHGYNIMSDGSDVTRRMYDLIVSEVRSAVAA